MDCRHGVNLGELHRLSWAANFLPQLQKGSSQTRQGLLTQNMIQQTYNNSRDEPISPTKTNESSPLLVTKSMKIATMAPFKQDECLIHI